MADRERISFMTKEQLEHYLRDLRTNRPTRPGGSRPPPPSQYQQKRLAAETEAARQRAKTVGEADPSSIAILAQQHSTAQDASTIDRKSSRLGRRDSHRRTRTTTSVSFDPVPTEFPSKPSQSGVDITGIEDGISGLDVGRPQDSINQAVHGSVSSRHSTKDSGRVLGHNKTHSVISHGSGSNWGSKESVVSSSTRAIPPYHPPPTKRLEKELQEHFQSNPPPVPHPAPSKVNRPYTNTHGGVVTTPDGSVNSRPHNPTRWVYNEPNQAPSSNKAEYTTNPIPLPSPPPELNSDGEPGAIGSRESRGRPPLPTMKVKRQPQEKDVAIAETLPHRDITPPSPTPPIPKMTVSGPPVPIICTPDEGDRLRNDNIPSINIPVDGEPAASQPQSRRPLPIPTGRTVPGARAISSLASAIPGRIGATCVCCHGSISGRIVTALGHRFHPGCFRCFHCHTHLEHVDFFPEPEKTCVKRAQQFGCRVDQLDRRFYCHLDYHELFSPRCKHCKTPIEGEVVVALGETWHVGHFFCAECGDPFTQSTNFVEKDKYAWCIGCYTKRYSSKCKKCRKPITDTVVKALGADWHVECFCCNTVKKAFSCFTGDSGEGQEGEDELAIPTKVRTPVANKEQSGNGNYQILERPPKEKEADNQETQQDHVRRPSTDSGFAERSAALANHNPVPEKKRLFSRNGSRSGSGLGYEKHASPARPKSAPPRKQLLKIQKSRSRVGTLTLVPPASNSVVSPKTSPGHARNPTPASSLHPNVSPTPTIKSLLA